MSSMGIRAVLTIFLLTAATVKAEDLGGVTFWRKDFTLICPNEGDWFRNNKNLDNNSKIINMEYGTHAEGLYSCKYDDAKITYKFYVKAKVCDNCYELDAALFALVIVADVLVTGIVMMIIYIFCKKKGSAQPAQSTKAPARPMGHDSAYEQLNPRTRNQDTYSVVNRTG